MVVYLSSRNSHVELQLCPHTHTQMFWACIYRNSLQRLVEGSQHWQTWALRLSSETMRICGSTPAMQGGLWIAVRGDRGTVYRTDISPLLNELHGRRWPGLKLSSISGGRLLIAFTRQPNISSSSRYYLEPKPRINRSLVPLQHQSRPHQSWQWHRQQRTWVKCEPFTDSWAKPLKLLRTFECIDTCVHLGLLELRFKIQEHTTSVQFTRKYWFFCCDGNPSSSVTSGSRLWRETLIRHQLQWPRVHSSGHVITGFNKSSTFPARLTRPGSPTLLRC